MKRIFYLSGAIFFLSFSQILIFQACSSEDNPSEPQLPSGLAFQQPGLVLTSDGEYWNVFPDDVNDEFVWRRRSEWDSPIPVSQIAQWAGPTFIDVSGNHWQFDFWNSRGWMNIGKPPGS